MDSVKIFKVNNDQEDELQAQIDVWVEKYKPQIKNTSISISIHSIAVAITFHTNKDY